MNMTCDDQLPPIESVLALVRGELSPAKRWSYRVILLLASVGVAAILSLWITEPRPLPTRLHVAFGVLCSIGLGWVSVLSWILLQRGCPLAIDRLATAWMATAACGLSLIVSVAIAGSRGSIASLATAAFIGAGLLGLSVYFLCRAYSLRSALQQRIQELRSFSNS